MRAPTPTRPWDCCVGRCESNWEGAAAGPTPSRPVLGQSIPAQMTKQRPRAMTSARAAWRGGSRAGKTPGDPEGYRPLPRLQPVAKGLRYGDFDPSGHIPGGQCRSVSRGNDVRPERQGDFLAGCNRPGRAGSSFGTQPGNGPSIDDYRLARDEAGLRVVRKKEDSLCNVIWASDSPNRMAFRKVGERAAESAR